MTDPRYIGTILYVGLAIFAALLAAGLLMQERRWSVQRTALLWGAEGLILCKGQRWMGRGGTYPAAGSLASAACC